MTDVSLPIFYPETTLFVIPEGLTQILQLGRRCTQINADKQTSEKIKGFIKR
jgi:hypothetical protein